MKITDVAVEILEVPVAQGYVAAGRAVDANWHVLARIRTADGIEGVGYVVKQRGELVRAIAQASRELAGHLMGMSVLEPEAAWQKLAARTDWVGPGGLQHWAIRRSTSRCGTPRARRWASRSTACLVAIATT